MENVTVKKMLKLFYKEGTEPGEDSYSEEDILIVMKSFAKLHVEAALKAAADMGFKEWEVEIQMGDGQFDKGNIIRSYPLENIK